MRKNSFSFSKYEFTSVLEAFCKERVMDLDIKALFDILHLNHIIVPLDGDFVFHFTYWLYYFAAQRMHHNAGFAEFILSDMNYSRFPELLEFYTGIDRRRENAVDTLLRDLRSCNQAVSEKYNIPDDVNPFRVIRWKPSPEILEKVREEVSEGVSASSLPKEIKDTYADSRYDPAAPYHQKVRDILNDFSLAKMMLTVRAGARALRNSDYVAPEKKKLLLCEIMQGWKEITKLMIVLMPLLALKEYVAVDGVGIFVGKGMGETPEERLSAIVSSLPFNVVSWYRGDLFSQKMSPLFKDYLNAESDEIKRHEMILFYILQRPAQWFEETRNYLNDVEKNSFYLYDMFTLLRNQYQTASQHPKN